MKARQTFPHINQTKMDQNWHTLTEALSQGKSYYVYTYTLYCETQDKENKVKCQANFYVLAKKSCLLAMLWFRASPDMYVGMILSDQVIKTANLCIWMSRSWLRNGKTVLCQSKSNYSMLPLYSVRQRQNRNKKCKYEDETSHAYMNSVKGGEIRKCAVIKGPLNM